MTAAQTQELVKAARRISGDIPFSVGVAEMPRVLVCLAGGAQLKHNGGAYSCGKGDVLLLPAVLGPSVCHPKGSVTLLDISLPEGA